MAKSTLGNRIKQVLDQKQMSQAELARLVGVKQQTIHYLCRSSGQTSRHSVRIAEVLGVNPAWLQSGEGDLHDPLALTSNDLTKIPVIRSNIDLVKQFLLERLHQKEIIGTLITDKNVGNKVFALEVDGQSMSPLYQPGDTIVIDPEVKPEPGDFVIAEVNKALVFRKYRPRQMGANGSEYFELAPLNDDFPSVRSDASKIKILGTVVEHRRYRKS